jgi:hypothetical protein
MGQLDRERVVADGLKWRVLYLFLFLFLGLHLGADRWSTYFAVLIPGWH